MGTSAQAKGMAPIGDRNYDTYTCYKEKLFFAMIKY